MDIRSVSVVVGFWIAVICSAIYVKNIPLDDASCRSMEVTTRFTPARVEIEKTNDSYIVREPAKVTVYRCVK